MKESVGRRLGISWTNNDSTMGFGANAETIAIGKAVLNLQVDEATLDNVDVYIVPDVSHPVDLLIGRPWCEAPEISYVKYENTLTYYNTIAFPFITTSATSSDSTTDQLLSVKPNDLKHKISR